MDIEIPFKEFAARLTADELRKHFGSRVIYHDSKAQAYDKQLEVLGDGEAIVTSNDPRPGIKSQRDAHVRLVCKFQFYEDHVADGVYHLDESTLRSLEFI